MKGCPVTRVSLPDFAQPVCDEYHNCGKIYCASTMYWRMNFTAFSRCGASALRSGELRKRRPNRKKGVIVHALDANGGTAVTTKSLTYEKMEARVARFNKLQTYQRQNFETHGIPAGAVEKITAQRVYPVMAPADYQGRSAGAPVKGPRGLIVSIAECEPGNGPGLHRHLNTVENFLCLSGRFEIAWGDYGEHKLVLEPLDMISVPRGENRSFRNVSSELGRLLVMIVPETDEQVDPISYSPHLAREIETEYGKTTLDGLQRIGFKFEEEPSA